MTRLTDAESPSQGALLTHGVRLGQIHVRYRCGVQVAGCEDREREDGQDTIGDYMRGLTVEIKCAG